MRRIDLINAVNKINNVFTKSNLFKLSSTEKNSVEAIMQAYRIFFEEYALFSENEKHVMSAFGFEDIADGKFWTFIIDGDRVNPAYYRRLRMFHETLPEVMELLKQHNVEYIEHNNSVEETISNNNGKELLTVILPEKDDTQSSPERLINLLDSINKFYNVFGIINQETDSPLSVAAIDSGSDKSFDFIGAAKIVAAVKELIIDLWDRVVFYKERKFAERLELVTKSLPILEKITELENGNIISPEQGELLKRDIIGGANKFISSGAITPEMEYHSTNTPRRIMAPEPKLLTSANNDVNNTHDEISISEDLEVVDDENAESQSDSELSKSEKEILKKLLRRSQKNNDIED